MKTQKFSSTVWIYSIVVKLCRLLVANEMGFTNNMTLLLQVLHNY